jgi:hypothetical protein
MIRSLSKLWSLKKVVSDLQRKVDDDGVGLSSFFLHRRRCGGQQLVQHCPGTAKFYDSAAERSCTKENITMALANCLPPGAEDCTSL